MSDARYSRQTILPQIGSEGQERLHAATAIIAGVGALGSAIAEMLARAGVGALRLIDRDYLELHNLQRQSLYTEADVASALPKALAASQRLSEINSDVHAEPYIADITPENVLDLLGGSGPKAEGHDPKSKIQNRSSHRPTKIVLDGTDNLQTRYLLNDACIRLGIPWVYSGVIGTSGVSMAVVPGQTACLRCLFPDLPPPGATQTCDVAGVLGPAVHAIAAAACAEAIKLLVGAPPGPGLLTADLWTGAFDRIEILRNPNCPACGHGRLDYLDGEAWGHDAARLCGHDAVQVRLSNAKLDLAALGARLRSSGASDVVSNEYIVRLRPDNRHELTIFADSRVIVKGTEDAAVARSLVARYIGI